MATTDMLLKTLPLGFHVKISKYSDKIEAALVAERLRALFLNHLIISLLCLVRA